LQTPNTLDSIHIGISISDSNIIYAVTHQYNFSNVFASITRAFKSVDEGDSWSPISEGVNLGGYWGGALGWIDQGHYDLCIAVDPLDPNHVYIGNVELHETTDGENFSPVRMPGGGSAANSIAHPDYHKLVFAPSDPGYLYIGCDGGVYCSEDGCTTAQSKSYGLGNFQFYRIGSHPTDPDKIIGGLQDNGTVLTEDGGETWTMVQTGDGMVCFFDYENPEIAYASHQYGSFRRSYDGGKTFSSYGDLNGAWVTPLIIHPKGHDTLYAANNDIYRRPYDTIPYQDYWQKITTDLSPYRINTLAQSSINPYNMILSGTYYSPSLQIVVMVSMDGGYTWTDVTANIPGEDKWIRQVITHPNQENTMYIVRCGFSDTNKIYKTTDLGETWINVSGNSSNNLPDIPCNDLFIDPEDTSHYYVGTDLGVYVSENEGESWAFAGDGLPKVPVLDFDYVKIEGTRYLRVATHGRGIYEAYLPPATAVEEFSDFKSTLRIMPNPSKNDFNVEYTLIRQGKVHIDIYNQLGGKVKMVLNKHQSKGKHELRINGNDLAAGIYFCTLKTGEGIQTRKIIKL